jgi:hypothetical protein
MAKKNLKINLENLAEKISISRIKNNLEEAPVEVKEESKENDEEFDEEDEEFEQLPFSREAREMQTTSSKPIAPVLASSNQPVENLEKFAGNISSQLHSSSGEDKGYTTIKSDYTNYSLNSKYEPNQTHSSLTFQNEVKRTAPILESRRIIQEQPAPINNFNRNQGVGGIDRHNFEESLKQQEEQKNFEIERLPFRKGSRRH